MNSKELDELDQRLDERYRRHKEAIKAMRELLREVMDGQTELSLAPSEADLAISNADRVRGVARAKGGFFSVKDIRAAHPGLTRQQITNAISTLRTAGELAVVKPGSGRKPAVYELQKRRIEFTRSRETATV